MPKKKVAKKKAATKNPADNNAELKALSIKLSNLHKKFAPVEAKYNTMKSEIVDLRDQIKDIMLMEGHSSFGNTKIKASIVTRSCLSISDPEVLNKYIKRTGNFQLYQQRLNSEAYNELISSGKKPPGIKTFEAKSLRVSYK